MKIYNSKNKDQEITSIEDWYMLCPPKEKNIQWKCKRSAKEMAKYWTDEIRRVEFLAYIQKVFPDLAFDYAIPEYPTAFDNYRNPRQNDLMMFAKYDNKNVLISIEGKADEAYGNNLVKEELDKAKKKLITSPNSKKLNRVEELIKRFKNLPELLECRYQLLTWFAGTIEEARRQNIDTIFLISQEFHSDETSIANIERNTNDLNRFIKLISNDKNREVKKNEIYSLIINEGINCYYGKYVSYL